MDFFQRLASCAHSRRAGGRARDLAPRMEVSGLSSLQYQGSRLGHEHFFAQRGVDAGSSRGTPNPMAPANCVPIRSQAKRRAKVLASSGKSG